MSDSTNLANGSLIMISNPHFVFTLLNFSEPLNYTCFYGTLQQKNYYLMKIL